MTAPDQRPNRDAPPPATIACADRPAANRSVSIARFADAMSAIASSVTLVTAASASGRHGRTVTAMLSLSAEPPSVLVSITRGSVLAETILEAGAFSVAVLAEGQAALADAFAGFSTTPDRFSTGDWTPWRSGQPRLVGAVASLDCVLAETIEADTHFLFAGIVVDTRSSPDLPPLLWRRRGYERLEG